MTDDELENLIETYADDKTKTENDVTKAVKARMKSLLMEVVGHEGKTEDD